MFKYILHRGYVDKNIKENSKEAIDKTLKNDLFYGIELDVRTSKDNIFVLAHDLIENNKIIRQTNYFSLKKAKIVKLEYILKKKTNKLIMLEIKESNIDYRKLTKLLNKYSNLNIYVSSFYNNVIDNIGKINHNFKIGVLNFVFNSEESYYHYDFIGLLSFIVTQKILDYFTNNNIEVFIYANNKKSLINNKYFYIVDYKNIKSTHI